MIFAKEPYLLHLLAGSETITALDAAKTLLDSKTHNANEREPTDNLTPLHVAAAWGNVAMCQLLIHYGADVDAQDIDKRRPVDVAAKGECRRFFKRLRKRRRKERSKFGKVLSFLFRCAHSPDAVNQSAVFVSAEELTKKRSSCPAGLAMSTSNQQNKISIIMPKNPQLVPSAPHPCASRRSSSLAREAFLTEDNSGTSVELMGRKGEIQQSENDAEIGDIEGEDAKDQQTWEVLRQQFAHLRIEDLREKLRKRNCAVGPVNTGNRRVYEAKLARLEAKQQTQQRVTNSIAYYSAALQRMILNKERNIVEQIGHEEDAQIRKDYSDPSLRKEVSFFCYLLIDPTKLPAMQPTAEIPFRCFLSAIFYIGKGKRSRPLQHLVDASKCRSHFAHTKPTEQSEKLKRILSLWDRGEGVISLHVFYNIHSAEAHVREGSMIDAIGIDNLTNLKRGSFPGQASKWSRQQIAQFGSFLLQKVHVIFQNERCRPIFETDLLNH